MWVINIQHWLNETKSGPAVPQLRLKVKKLSEIITYATSVAAGIIMESTPKCWRRPKRKACKGELDIDLDFISGQIHWRCGICGDDGVVSGWQGLIWDMLDRSDNVH
jgi:hypothetical protein